MLSKFRGLGHWRKNLWPIVLGVILGFLSACTAPRSQILLDGQAIFKANCSSCHTIGGGNLAGPDLKGITEQEGQKWLVNFISDPNLMITSGDPRANELLKQFNYVVMPNMGLSRDQVLAIITFITAESGLVIAPTPGGTPEAGLTTGNPENGKAIFLGEVHLKNGGPFCIGCHSINNTGILGGGTLGPNLTEAYIKYGDAGLEGILSNLPFLTMRPVFSNNTLTVDERADLRAFIMASAGKPQVNKEPWIIAISLASFLAAIALIAFIWRHRLQGVRWRLVQKSRRKK